MKKNKKLLSCILGASLFLFASCGEDIRELTEAIENATDDVMEDAQFRAEFTGLNSEVADEVSGEATLAIEDGELVVEIDMDNVPAETVHPQHIHVGETCATMEDDANEDGFVDIAEAKEVMGDVFLPLDSELADEEGEFPAADASGNYFYSQSAPIEELVRELLEEGEEELNLEGKVIEIHGVSEETELPETVATEGDRPPHETLPIACAVIVDVEDDDTGNVSNGDDNADDDNTDDTADDDNGDVNEEDDSQKPQQQRQKV